MAKGTFMSDDFSGEVRPKVSLPSPPPGISWQGEIFFNLFFFLVFFPPLISFVFFSFDFLIQVLLCSPDRPATQGPPASVP